MFRHIAYNRPLFDESVISRKQSADKVVAGKTKELSSQELNDNQRDAIIKTLELINADKTQFLSDVRLIGVEDGISEFITEIDDKWQEVNTTKNRLVQCINNRDKGSLMILLRRYVNAIGDCIKPATNRLISTNFLTEHQTVVFHKQHTWFKNTLIQNILGIQSIISFPETYRTPEINEAFIQDNLAKIACELGKPGPFKTLSLSYAHKEGNPEPKTWIENFERGLSTINTYLAVKYDYNSSEVSDSLYRWIKTTFNSDNPIGIVVDENYIMKLNAEQSVSADEFETIMSLRTACVYYLKKGTITHFELVKDLLSPNAKYVYEQCTTDSIYLDLTGKKFSDGLIRLVNGLFRTQLSKSNQEFNSTLTLNQMQEIKPQLKRLGHDVLMLPSRTDDQWISAVVYAYFLSQIQSNGFYSLINVPNKTQEIRSIIKANPPISDLELLLGKISASFDIQIILIQKIKNSNELEYKLVPKYPAVPDSPNRSKIKRGKIPLNGTREFSENTEPTWMPVSDQLPENSLILFKDKASIYPVRNINVSMSKAIYGVVNELAAMPGANPQQLESYLSNFQITGLIKAIPLGSGFQYGIDRVSDIEIAKITDRIPMILEDSPNHVGSTILHHANLNAKSSCQIKIYIPAPFDHQWAINFTQKIQKVFPKSIDFSSDFSLCSDGLNGTISDDFFNPAKHSECATLYLVYCTLEFISKLSTHTPQAVLSQINDKKNDSNLFFIVRRLEPFIPRALPQFQHINVIPTVADVAASINTNPEKKHLNSLPSLPPELHSQQSNYKQNIHALVQSVANGKNEQTARLIHDEPLSSEQIIEAFNFGELFEHHTLHYFCNNGDYHHLQRLFETSEPGQLNVNSKINGYTPLVLASKSGSRDIVMYLLRKGASVLAQTDRGATALHWAVFKKDEEIVNLLLDCPEYKNDSKKKNINIKNCIGITPLHWAVCMGANEISKALISRGAQWHLKEILGYTCLDLAHCHGRPSTVEYLRSLQSDTPTILNNFRHVARSSVIEAVSSPSTLWAEFKNMVNEPFYESIYEGDLCFLSYYKDLFNRSIVHLLVRHVPDVDEEKGRKFLNCIKLNQIDILAYRDSLGLDALELANICQSTRWATLIRSEYTNTTEEKPQSIFSTSQIVTQAILNQGKITDNDLDQHHAMISKDEALALIKVAEYFEHPPALKRIKSRFKDYILDQFDDDFESNDDRLKHAVDMFISGAPEAAFSTLQPFLRVSRPDYLTCRSVQLGYYVMFKILTQYSGSVWEKIPNWVEEKIKEHPVINQFLALAEAMKRNHLADVRKICNTAVSAGVEFPWMIEMELAHALTLYTNQRFEESYVKYRDLYEKTNGKHSRVTQNYVYQKLLRAKRMPDRTDEYINQSIKILSEQIASLSDNSTTLTSDVTESWHRLLKGVAHLSNGLDKNNNHRKIATSEFHHAINRCSNRAVFEKMWFCSNDTLVPDMGIQCLTRILGPIEIDFRVMCYKLLVAIDPSQTNFQQFFEAISKGNFIDKLLYVFAIQEAPSADDIPKLRPNDLRRRMALSDDQHELIDCIESVIDRNLPLDQFYRAIQIKYDTNKTAEVLPQKTADFERRVRRALNNSNLLLQRVKKLGDDDLIRYIEKYSQFIGLDIESNTDHFDPETIFLHEVCCTGNVEEFQKIVQYLSDHPEKRHTYLFQKNKMGWTAAHVAAYHRRFDFLESMISLGGKGVLNACDTFGRNVVYLIENKQENPGSDRPQRNPYLKQICNFSNPSILSDFEFIDEIYKANPIAFNTKGIPYYLIGNQGTGKRRIQTIIAKSGDFDICWRISVASYAAAIGGIRCLAEKLGISVNQASTTHLLNRINERVRITQRKVLIIYENRHSDAALTPPNWMAETWEKFGRGCPDIFHLFSGSSGPTTRPAAQSVFDCHRFNPHIRNWLRGVVTPESNADIQNWMQKVVSSEIWSFFDDPITQFCTAAENNLWLLSRFKFVFDQHPVFWECIKDHSTIEQIRTTIFEAIFSDFGANQHPVCVFLNSLKYFKNGPIPQVIWDTGASPENKILDLLQRSKLIDFDGNTISIFPDIPNFLDSFYNEPDLEIKICGRLYDVFLKCFNRSKAITGSSDTSLIFSHAIDFLKNCPDEKIDIDKAIQLIVLMSQYAAKSSDANLMIPIFEKFLNNETHHSVLMLEQARTYLGLNDYKKVDDILNDVDIPKNQHHQVGMSYLFQAIKHGFFSQTHESIAKINDAIRHLSNLREDDPFGDRGNAYLTRGIIKLTHGFLDSSIEDFVCANSVFESLLADGHPDYAMAKLHLAYAYLLRSRLPNTSTQASDLKSCRDWIEGAVDIFGTIDSLDHRYLPMLLMAEGLYLVEIGCKKENNLSIENGLAKLKDAVCGYVDIYGGIPGENPLSLFEKQFGSANFFIVRALLEFCYCARKYELLFPYWSKNWSKSHNLSGTGLIKNLKTISKRTPGHTNLNNYPLLKVLLECVNKGKKDQTTLTEIQDIYDNSVRELGKNLKISPNDHYVYAYIPTASMRSASEF